MSTVIQLFSSVVIAIIVTYLAHYFTSQRDLKNRRREQRVEYLIAAYHIFSSICNRDRADNEERIDEVERAVASIKLLGSSGQIRLVQKFETELVNDESVYLGDLLKNLRDSLRRELGLEAIAFDTPSLHIGRKPKTHA